LVDFADLMKNTERGDSRSEFRQPRIDSSSEWPDSVEAVEVERYERAGEMPDVWPAESIPESVFAPGSNPHTANGCVVIGNLTSVPVSFMIGTDNFAGGLGGPFTILPNRWMPFGYPGASVYYVSFPDFVGVPQYCNLPAQRLPPGIIAMPNNCTFYNFHYHLDAYGTPTGGLVLLRHR
jgi:hypothetical protein